MIDKVRSWVLRKLPNRLLPPAASSPASRLPSSLVLKPLSHSSPCFTPCHFCPLSAYASRLRTPLEKESGHDGTPIAAACRGDGSCPDRFTSDSSVCRRTWTDADTSVSYAHRYRGPPGDA